jgi:S1-C subfamily serine protease
MTDASLSDVLAGAVQAARAGVVRIESGRCGTTSGTVFGDDLIVTSQHALRSSDEATVVDDAGVERRADLVGADSGTDVALLRVQGGGLTKPVFAAHEPLRVGELAVALGRPGVSIRASLRIIGLLSGEVRTPSGGRLDRYIETDRGLPDGFSGGPLVNTRAELIGMNTSTLLRGSDLALPHVTLERVVGELLAHGRVRRGYLGVATQPVRLPAALRSALSQRGGALVLDTEENGPAHAAGLVLGDVIVGVDQTPVRNPRELSAALADKIGAAVTLRIVRGGKLETVQVTIGERG